jgi:hypothetical protein
LLDQSEWAEIAEPLRIKKPYMLCYSIADDSTFNDVIRILRKKMNCKLVCINLRPFNKFNADFSLVDVSPQNFIWLFQNAEFICTSSYHGTAFSVLFEKQFYVAPGKLRASRHESLLGQLSLNNRLLYNSSSIEKMVELEKINYEDVSKKLYELKNDSINYLASSFS